MSRVPRRILTVNAGSSSLKLRVLGELDEVLGARDGEAITAEHEVRRELEAVLLESGEVEAVGHRVVHGGAEFTGPTVVTPAVEEELDRLAKLAPLHNPPAVAAMRALEQVAPGLPTVACFDTAFHASLPAAAYTYAVPASWREQWHLRRFGFHGLSHAYAARRAAQLLGRAPSELRLVTAHLGSGASLAAVQGGQSVDTTMGCTPIEGLVMATRSGSVDPGLLLWVQREKRVSAEEMETLLERESGLLALCGRSDMRDVLAGADDDDPACRLALDVYLHRLVGSICAMAGAMGGIDGLVFTGGVGEHASAIWASVCERAAFLGLDLDRAERASHELDRIISSPRAPTAVLVVASREDIELASQVRITLEPWGREAGGIRRPPS